MIDIIRKFFKKEELLEINKVDTVIIPKDTDMCNSVKVLRYICKDIERSILLTSYMKDKLTNIFGAHNTRLKVPGYHYYVWMLKYGEQTFTIYTDKNRGTIIANSGNCDEKLCLDIIKKLEILLKNESK